MTLRSATAARAALAGAVVCLVGVGLGAPALAGDPDDGRCPGDGPIRSLLAGVTCREEPPAARLLAPGALLDPAFPDLADLPELPGSDDENGDEDEDDDSGDTGDTGDTGEEDTGDEDEDEDAPGSDEDRSEDAGDGTGSDPATEGSTSERDDGTAETVHAPAQDEESTTAVRAEGSDDARGSDRETPRGRSGAEDARETRRAAAATADAGADTAVGVAVLPGVGDAVDGAGSRGLDWTGALGPPPSGPGDPPVGGPPPPPPVAAADGAGSAATAFTSALPSPADARWDAAAVLPSLALTLLLLAGLALPAGLLNRAVADRPDRVDALLARLRVPPGADPDSPAAFVAAVAVTAVAGAVLLGFLTPAFPFDATAPAVLVGLVVAFLVVTAAQQGTQLLYVTRWWGVRCHLGPVPGFLLLGAVAVVASRALGLEPGLVLGCLLVFRPTRPLRPDEEGPAVALAAAALTVAGAFAWIGRDPLVAAAGGPGTFLADALATALTATAVGAACNLVSALVPVSILPGAALLRWSPALWALFACTGGFAFVHLVVRPGTDALAGRAGLLAVLLGCYLVGAAAFWGWLRREIDVSEFDVGEFDVSTVRFSVVPRR